MVSYYNHPFSMYQKSGNLTTYSPAASWYPPNYHTPGSTQFLPGADSSPQQVYYSHVFHQPSPDWITHDNYTPPSQASYLQAPLGIVNPHHHTTSESTNEVLQSIPSPAITISGSDVSSPCAASPQSINRPSTSKSPFEWMKKSSYQCQPNPGKTRTKDKYRVVYSDHQRLELEKEFHYTRYITIRRKSELAQTLQLSERKVKIWFQNRRAKDRKQKKKMDTPPSNGVNINNEHAAMSKILESNSKLESFHLQHLHQMSFSSSHNMHVHHN